MRRVERWKWEKRRKRTRTRNEEKQRGKFGFVIPNECNEKGNILLSTLPLRLPRA